MAKRQRLAAENDQQERVMTPERWKQIDELAQSALERGGDERAAFLDKACAGDDSLRREVESQIAYQQQASKFLEEPAYKHAAESIADPQIEAESMEGRTISHYRIMRNLGGGGMGEVYLAQDTTLSRKVAIKFISQNSVAGEQARKRLVREAKAAAALDHPHICAVYEVGEEAGYSFIVMQYVGGETLASRIQRQPIEVRETLEIAVQIADALADAHSHRIIHRDVKPQNVMLTASGQVKVLDFGLARVVREGSLIDSIGETESILTMPGAVIGTVPYMSPEQVRGEALDGRSDIFSFGAVLYEMLSGQQPFQSESVGATMSSILTKEPAPLARYASEVPDELQRIVRKALSKDKEGRYQGIKDLLIDLRDLKQELEFEAKLERLIEPVVRDPSTTPQRGESAQRAEVETLPQRTVRTTASSTSVVIGELQRHKLAVSLTLAAIVVAMVAAFFYFNRKPVLTDKDTILLADFTNTTGDAVFDGTLKQGLAVQLGQSPFLNVFADDRVRETLRLMNRSPDERVTPAIGREICQRQGLKAMLTGSIASLGRNYVITLEAINAQTGDAIAREQVEADNKEQVLRSLGDAATSLRRKLGEPLASIQKFDAPLEQVTTSSLEALKAVSMGNEQNLKGKFLESIASLKHAIELDPNFAYAYGLLQTSYSNNKQPRLGAEAAQRAFELRGRVSEREKLHIASYYYAAVTGEINKTIEALELCTQTYPRDENARHNLGFQYGKLGQYEKEVEAYREVLRLNPSRGMTRSNLSWVFIRLNRFEEAKALSEEAMALKFDSASTHGNFFNIAFIQGDTAAMKQQVNWSSGRPGEYAHLNWQADAAAFAGQWQKAREFSNRAAELTEQRKLQEEAVNILSSSAEWAAVLGHCQQSRADLARAAALPRRPLSFFRASMALALCGEAAQAQALNDEAVKQYPKNTVVNEIYSPLVRAELEIQRGNRTQAIQMLQAVSRYESVTFFYSNYLRGQAYLGERNGVAAAGEFQTILDHRGWYPSSPLFPLAHLGLARAAMLQGDVTKARASYQDFLAIWKDADADLPILIEAKKEYEKVK
jgi:eukaryotic-like serine/threonine-protein kinase